MRRAVVLGIASLLGCSEHHAVVVDGGAPDAGATQYVVCDGSNEVRLGVEHQRSFLGDARAFVHPYGYSFLYVLGDCTYLAGSSRLGFMVEGTLSAAGAAKLVQDLRLDELGGPDAVRHGCDDGDHYVVATRDELEFCSCDCERDASPVLDAAPAAIRPPIEAGTKLAGAVEVAAVAVERDPSRSYRAWPLTLDLATFAGSADDYWDEQLIVQTLADDDADTLRAMRDDDADRRDGEPLFVEQAGATYEVYVLDVVPARFVEAIARFDELVNPPPI